MRTLIERGVRLALVLLIVAAFLMVVTRGGHLHWVFT
jgi:hypothetical protein